MKIEANMMALRRLMSKHGLSTHQIAAELKVASQTVRAYRCGQRYLSKDHLEKLTAKYGA